VRLYVVFRPQGADELHRRYPSLRILFLTAFCSENGEDNPWDRELARLKGFCQILPFRPSGPETPKP